jgi:hypothetical protein
VSCIREFTVERTAGRTSVGQNLQSNLTGLIINLSTRGLCVLLDWSPELGEVLRIHVPTPVAMTQTPTLADVRWVQVLPFREHHFVVAGLKFLV